ncbi:ABC transporter substrate-binding protein [Nesterenkonia muleiensis]|uniref:ABC transporter substrate-binding protein n=1 Tax=Nesterenkonia muleiensis TaxID=2282648 RepID=UPI000E74A9FE|nr:sugar ABC transporter substrate-binding protein [Nesterenkonia muleiensis]
MARTRTSVAATSLLSTVLLLSSCGGGNGEDEVVLTWLNPHAGAYEPVVEAFEERNEGVRIELQSVPFDQVVEQTQARLGAGDTGIDIVSVDPPRLANMVAQGFLTNESEYLPEMEDQFIEAGINSVTADGEQWAYPLWTSNNFLFYNREALENAGVEIPGESHEDRLTWEDVLKRAEEVVDAGETTYGFGMDQVDRYYALQPMIESIGAGNGLTGDDNLTPEVNTPEWVEFGEWYSDIHSSGLAPRGVEPEQMVDLFRSGQSAFLLGGASAIGRMQDGDFSDSWGMAPHPYFENGAVVTPTDSWAIGITSTTEHEELAREFVQFATLNPGGAELASSVNTLPPVNTEAFEAYVDFIQDLAPEQTEGFSELFRIDSEEHARHRPESVGYVHFETQMNQAFSDIRNGANVENTLNQGQQALDRELANLENLAADN